MRVPKGWRFLKYFCFNRTIRINIKGCIKKCSWVGLFGLYSSSLEIFPSFVAFCSGYSVMNFCSYNFTRDAQYFPIIFTWILDTVTAITPPTGHASILLTNLSITLKTEFLFNFAKRRWRINFLLHTGSIILFS